MLWDVVFLSAKLTDKPSKKRYRFILVSFIGAIVIDAVDLLVTLSLAHLTDLVNEIGSEDCFARACDAVYP